jgi:small subunit ribosomal protein S5
LQKLLAQADLISNIFMAEKTTTTSRGGATTGGASRGRGGAGNTGSRGPRRANFERVKPEYDQKILDIRRVTRVVSGGRRMTFSVAMAIGDRKGMVGLGTGKAIDTSMAIAKAQKSAKKNMLKLKLTKTMSLPHDISAKFGSAEVMLMPNRGRGMIAGSVLRDLLLLGGVKDVTSKIHSGSKNKLNNARATMKAFATIGTKVLHHKIASDRAEKAAESAKLAAEALVATEAK